MVKRRVAVVIFLLCLCISLLPCHAWAASTIDAQEQILPEKDGSLTIAYRYDGKNFSDLPVRLYKIANVSADLQYSLTEPFSHSGMVLNGVQSAGEWDVIRATLETHILADDIEADFTNVTDRTGQVHFQTLKPGLYLAITEHVLQNDWVYAFDSALIALPGLSPEGLWQYEVTAVAKAEAIPPIEGDEEMELSVLKLWKGDAGAAARPATVTVEIFCNGKSYQTVTLSEDNHWSYTWSVKDDGSDWKVVERNIPAGYTVTVEERETTFVITNTLTQDEPDPPAPPKTGDTSNTMLWIVLMIISGSVLVILGITRKRSSV